MFEVFHCSQRSEVFHYSQMLCFPNVLAVFLNSISSRFLTRGNLKVVSIQGLRCEVP